MTTRPRILIVGALAGLLLSVPAALWALDAFTDVGDGNVFHDDITWLRDSGVTIGCNPPDNTLFCPSDEVTREQMAAFLHRLAENQVVDAASVGGLDAAQLLSGDTPPAGVTVRGAYLIDFEAEAVGERGSTTISYGVTLDGTPTAHFIALGEDPIAECPGSASDPQAMAGHLCVYEGDVSLTGSTPTVGGHCLASVVPYDCGFATDSGSIASPWGAGLSVEVLSVTGGPYFSAGSWALTTPEPGTLTPMSATVDRPESPYAR